MRSKIFLVLLISLIFTSCASVKFEGSAVLTGCVRDGNGKPVPNYHVSGGLFSNAITDSAGIFVLRDLASGNITLTGSGKGWRSVEEHISFYDRKSIVCIQTDRLETMLPEIELLLRDKKFDEAMKVLYSSKNKNENDEVFLCYKKLIEFCALPGEKEKAAFLAGIEKL